MTVSKTVSQRVEGVVTLHLPIAPLNIRSGMDPVPRCEPSTCQSIRLCLSHCTIEDGPDYLREVMFCVFTISDGHLIRLLSV